MGFVIQSWNTDSSDSDRQSQTILSKPTFFAVFQISEA